MKLPNTLTTKLLLALVATATAASAADPFLGSWKINADKSALPPQRLEEEKGSVLTLESAGKDTYRVTVAVPAAAPDANVAKIWVADGKQRQEEHLGHPINIKVERLSDLHLRTATWGDQGTPLVYDWTVSADGKTLTATTKSRREPETIVYTKE